MEPRRQARSEDIVQAAPSVSMIDDSRSDQPFLTQALQKMGLVDMLHPDTLSPEALAERITAALTDPQEKPTASIDVGGLERVADHILAMARSGE